MLVNGSLSSILFGVGLYLEVIEKVTHRLTLLLRGESNSIVTDESQPNGYFDATYHAGSVSESNSLVHKSHSLQPKGYFHATYAARSDSESNSLVDKSLGMQPNSFFHATYHHQFSIHHLKCYCWNSHLQKLLQYCDFH